MQCVQVGQVTDLTGQAQNLVFTMLRCVFKILDRLVNRNYVDDWILSFVNFQALYSYVFKTYLCWLGEDVSALFWHSFLRFLSHFIFLLYHLIHSTFTLFHFSFSHFLLCVKFR